MIAKKKSALLYVLVIVIVTTCSIAYAEKISEISFTNWFETGSVDVRIRQYEVTEKGEVLSTPGQVMPNQDVSYIPRVLNLRAESYVRVKVTIQMEAEIANPITYENVLGLNKEWVQRGEYFYLTKSLKTNETSDLFRGFHVPKEWEQGTASGFTIHVTVDALQKEHVAPDFDSIVPWGTVKIEHAKQEDNIDYGIAKKKQVSHLMEYTALDGLESKTSDLFTNFNYFMAGDTYKDTLQMKNQSDGPIKLYFKTETMDKDLTSKMNVKIYCDGKILYDGKLHSPSLSQYQYLTIVPSKTIKDFDFEVHLPQNSKNYYSVLKDKVIWKFSCKELGTTESNVQTGDEGNGMLVWMLLVIYAILMILLAKKNGGIRNE